MNKDPGENVKRKGNDTFRENELPVSFFSFFLFFSKNHEYKKSLIKLTANYAAGIISEGKNC